MLVDTVFNKYFPIWLKILHFIYICTLPVIAFAAIRLPAILLYLILQIHTQMILLNYKIKEISENSNYVVEDKTYQNDIHTKLSLCIHHHAFLKK